ncbi:hypothetical protein C8R46DRAFT_1191886 [Mycena filopes]|nr:hypothetical protein C8R46DRAFT_1191886 [Mycena filopes]
MSEPESPDASFSPSVKDLLAARDALLCLLPLELVYILLHLAEYWVQDTTDRVEYHDIHNPSTHNANVCYLLASPIRPLDAEMERLKIMRVVFTTVSHDQGWGGEYGTQGTYRQSYTWFEAAILRRPPAASVDSDSSIAHAPDADTGMEYDPAFEVAKDDDAEGSPSTRWLVQRNVVAAGNFRQHSVAWPAPAPPAPADSGAGAGAGFVERLDAGDVIAVVARAIFHSLPPSSISKVSIVHLSPPRTLPEVLPRCSRVCVYRCTAT